MGVANRELQGSWYNELAKCIHKIVLVKEFVDFINKDSLATPYIKRYKNISLINALFTALGPVNAI